ncbi:MAG: response regulator, partial [Bacteroidota bacterium]
TLDRTSTAVAPLCRASLEFIKPQALKKRIQVDLELPHCLPEITVDERRIRQVLINLLNNAVKFTAEGEVVLCIEGKPSTQTEGHLKFTFAVRDTGLGIPKDRMNRLFKSFSQVDASTTRQFGGTGLGLAISRKLSQLMGGEMWVESEGIPGKGSTFFFTIEAFANVDEKEVAFKDAIPTLSGKRVLIVDDNATNRKILRQFAEKWELNSTLVDSGAAALEALQQDYAFDLAILDMHMPGMDGVELGNKIKARSETSGIPLIMLSSIADRGNIPENLFALRLNKPIKRHQLFNGLCNVLTNRAAVIQKERKKSDFDPDMAKAFPLRILLAEDNLVNQRVVGRILSKLGYRADIAGNGEEALESIHRQPYDLILMDVQMPIMDGLTASRTIREKIHRDQQPYIIALTANALQGDRERCLQAGMDDYLSKPVRIGELVEKLAQIPSKKQEQV